MTRKVVNVEESNVEEVDKISNIEEKVSRKMFKSLIKWLWQPTHDQFDPPQKIIFLAARCRIPLKSTDQRPSKCHNCDMSAKSDGRIKIIHVNFRNT